jgi:hypothetical protein
LITIPAPLPLSDPESKRPHRRGVDDRVMFGLSAHEIDQLTRLLAAVGTATVSE